MAGSTVNVNIIGQLGEGGGSVQGTVSAYQDITNVVKREANAIMKEAGEKFLVAARQNIHNDTGALSASGRVVVVQTGKGPRAEILFGGDEFPVTPTRNTRGGVNGDGVVDYAFFVHEGISPAGRGASSGVKFFERAVMSEQAKVGRFIANKIKNATKLKRPRR